MLAYARSTAFFSRTLHALVGADARPQALLALAPTAVMLAYLRSAAVLARALAALVGADARPQALLAQASDAVMLAYLLCVFVCVSARAHLARAPWWRRPHKKTTQSRQVPYKGREGLVEAVAVAKVMTPLNGKDCGWVGSTG